MGINFPCPGFVTFKEPHKNHKGITAVSWVNYSTCIQSQRLHFPEWALKERQQRGTYHYRAFPRWCRCSLSRLMKFVPKYSLVCWVPAACNSFPSLEELLRSFLFPFFSNSTTMAFAFFSPPFPFSIFNRTIRHLCIFGRSILAQCLSGDCFHLLPLSTLLCPLTTPFSFFLLSLGRHARQRV